MEKTMDKAIITVVGKDTPARATGEERPVPEQRRAGEVRHAPGKRDRPESGACSRG